MRKVLGLLTLFTVVALLAAACVLQEPEEASAPIEAIPLDDEESSGGGDSTAEESMVQVYEIVQTESEARFELDEDLRGERKTVVGATDQVAGQIAVGYDDLSTAEVGTIQLDARTLTTDNNLRNRAINRFILETNDFQLITFEPAAVLGLPDRVAVGETVEFDIAGDLTIRDVTNPVTFDVVATLVSAERLEGSASATVSRGDFGLRIPSVPNVANVEEEVELAIDFVAETA